MLAARSASQHSIIINSLVNSHESEYCIKSTIYSTIKLTNLSSCNMTNYRIYRDEEYNVWYEMQTNKSKRQILKHLSKIEEDGHFGHINDLDEDNDDLKELKFNDGRRIYYIIIPIDNVILLLGDNKNGQDKDIKKARGIIAKAQNRAKARRF